MRSESTVSQESNGKGEFQMAVMSVINTLALSGEGRLETETERAKIIGYWVANQGLLRIDIRRKEMGGE